MSSIKHTKSSIDKDGNETNIDFTKIFDYEYYIDDRSEAYYLEHCKSVDNLAKIFRTDLQKGLNSNDSADLEWREKMWGNNNFQLKKKNSILEHIIDCFQDPTLKVLVLASIVSLIIGIAKDGLSTGWMEGTAILFAVFIVVAVSSYMSYNEKEQFLKLSSETNLKKVVVIRDGQEKLISSEAVLVGDILKLRIGDNINVDGIIYGTGKVEMDETGVIGEPDLMKKIPTFEKKDKKYACPFIFSGSIVQNGQGNMLVVAVGEHTFEGGNKALMNLEGYNEEIEEDVELFSLKNQLNDLTNMIGNFGYIMAILIGFLMIIKEYILMFIGGISLFSFQAIDVLVNAFIITVIVIIIAIPEGLPMAVTISLANSVDSIKKEHVKCKNLNKLETMINVNDICTDKTGTLTLGEMRVIALYIEKVDYRLSQSKVQDPRLRELIWNCIWKNITVIESFNEKGEKVLTGDMTEKALYNYLKNEYNSFEGNRIGDYVLPFKSDYKYMMNIYKTDNGYILYAKGALESLGEFFSKFQVENGKEESFRDNKKDLFDKQTEYAEDCMSTLCFGYKKLTARELEAATRKYPEQNLPFFQELAKNLTFAFMIGIKDDNRADVPAAISTCHKEGITVRMVTGDNINTAIAISKEVGIIKPEDVKDAKRIAQHYRDLVKGKNKFTSDEITKSENPIALEGEIFREICGKVNKKFDEETSKMDISLNNIDNFKHIVKRLNVIAGASTEDKFILVIGLKQLGNIVAVTGDEINDGPTLKNAHVGFAMGIRGTDIAKESADIVLLDDSFSSIVTAYKYGRNIYDFIRKFVQFIITTFIVTIFMTFLGNIILKDSPLSAIKILWVNLIMDSFASLALSNEKPSNELLNRKLYSRDANILTSMMKLNIISQALLQIIILTIILLYGDIIFGVPSDRELHHFVWNNVNGYHLTIFFDIFVFMQLFNLINSRKLSKDEYNVFSGILENLCFIFIQSFILLGQIIIVNCGGRAARVKPLSINQHCVCLGIASLTLICRFIVNLLPIDTTEPNQDMPDQKNEDKYRGDLKMKNE